MDHSVVTTSNPTSCRKPIPLTKAEGRRPQREHGQHTDAEHLGPRASGVEVSRLTAPAGDSAPHKPGQQVEPLGPESPAHGHEFISSRVVGVFGRLAVSGLRHSVASQRGREPRVGAVDHISGDHNSNDARPATRRGRHQVDEARVKSVGSLENWHDGSTLHRHSVSGLLEDAEHCIAEEVVSTIRSPPVAQRTICTASSAGFVDRSLHSHCSTPSRQGGGTPNSRWVAIRKSSSGILRASYRESAESQAAVPGDAADSSRAWPRTSAKRKRLLI
eukprot:SM000009S23658  [mRNA]  locus=s9:1177247:1178137:- [translate_table: standard]